MKIKKVDYQVKATNELVEKTEILLNKQKDSLILVFKSPTGSGKTIMTAKYIQKIINTLDDDLCFIWVSIGKGDLHIQSRDKLINILLVVN